MLEIRPDEILPRGFKGDWDAHLRASEKARARRRPPMPRIAPAIIASPQEESAVLAAEIRAIEPSYPNILLRQDRISFAEIEVAARQHFSLTRSELWSNRRGAEISAIRRQIYWMASKHTELSLPQIGRLCGNRDHTTCLSGIHKMEMLIAAGEPKPNWFIPRDLDYQHNHLSLRKTATEIAIRKHDLVGHGTEIDDDRFWKLAECGYFPEVRDEIMFSLNRSYHLRLHEIAAVCNVPYMAVSNVVRRIRPLKKLKRATA